MREDVTQTIVRLRSWLQPYANGDKAVLLAGQPLPTLVGATLTQKPRVLCTAPGDWLLVSSEHTAAELGAELSADLSIQGLVLTDLSDGLVIMELRDPYVRELLAKGCGLDFHVSAFIPGMCARTRFAQLPVVLLCKAENAFELFVARSYAVYLRMWLIDAAVEFEYSKDHVPDAESTSR